MTTPSELRGLSERATPGELFARVIVRDGEVIDAFLTVPSIVQGQSIAGPIVMDWLADDSYHEGGPEQKAHDARFTAACVNEIRRQLSEGGGGDKARMDFLESEEGSHRFARFVMGGEWRDMKTFHWHPTLRAALDAALSAQHQGERSE